jgi:hypothetical protein
MAIHAIAHPAEPDGYRSATDQEVERDRSVWGSVAPLGEFDQPLLVKPDLELKFETGGTDFVQDVRIGKDLIPLKSTLAVREDAGGNCTEMLVHANYRVRVMRGTEDVSTKHRVLRYLAIWDATLDQNNVRVGSYMVGDTKGRNRAVCDTVDAPAGIWLDIPGMRFVTRPLSRQRALYEFFITVQPEGKLPPQAEWIYFIVIVDYIQTGYRVRVSDKVTISPTLTPNVSPFIARSQPYKNELAQGPTAITWAYDSGPQTYEGREQELPDPP